MAIEEAEKLFDHPLKQYLYSVNLKNRLKPVTKDIPDALAVNKHAQAYYVYLKRAT
jgi:type I restriction enzyme R subunit